MEAKASQYSADTLLQNEDYSYNCASIFWAILNELMLIDEHANGLITIKSECQNQPKKQILLLLGTKNENLELIVKVGLDTPPPPPRLHHPFGALAPACPALGYTIFG